MHTYEQVGQIRFFSAQLKGGDHQVSERMFEIDLDLHNEFK